MIQQIPARENEQYQDIKALYEYLLYQTLPFPPESYLPEDANGFYYYENGDRSKEKVYVTEPIRCGLRPVTVNFFTSKIKKYFPDRDVPEVLPDTLEKLICFVSTDLHRKLYGSGGNIQRASLLDILYAIPNQQNREALDFPLNPIRKGTKQNSAFLTAIRKVLYTEAFNYDEFSKNSRFPALIQSLNVPVCPYCNRSFTTTAKKKDGSFHRQNQIDHYAPKSHFPWLALSLNNMTPVCANCNQKKGNTTAFVLYPYEEGFGDAYSFHTVPISGIRYLFGLPNSEKEFEIVIERNPNAPESADAFYHQRVKNSIDKLGLDTLYRDSHNAYVAEIFKQRYIFSDAYIDSLISSFPNHFKTRSDVRSMMYLKDIEQNNEPLSKLTRDIDEEITQFQK